MSLAQALRVLRPGGVLVAAAISRFASLLDGLRQGWLADEDFAAVVKQDLQTGQHSRLLAVAETVEREPSMLGVSPHLLAIAHLRHDA